MKRLLLAAAPVLLLPHEVQAWCPEAAFHNCRFVDIPLGDRTDDPASHCRNVPKTRACASQAQQKAAARDERPKA